MTKSEIIQRLLDEKHVTVEEAMTLMQYDTIPVVMPNQPAPYYPPNQPAPYYPLNQPAPYYPPNRPGDIWYTTSTGTTTTKTTLND